MSEVKSWLVSFVGTGLDWVAVIAIIATVVLAILRWTHTITISKLWVCSPLLLLGALIVGIYVWVAVEAMRGEL